MVADWRILLGIHHSAAAAAAAAAEGGIQAAAMESQHRPSSPFPQDSADFHWSGGQIDSVASQSHTWDLVAVVAVVAAAAGCTAVVHH